VILLNIEGGIMEYTYIIETIRKVIKEKDSDFPYDCCHHASVVFYKILEYIGIKSSVIYGYWHGFDHFWNKINDDIIDITLDQFDNFYGVVSKEYYKEWYQIKNEENLDYLNDINDDDGIIEDYNDSIKKCLKILGFCTN
jgi:hypothetical protein